MKLVTVIGARPQFIKAAPVSRALADHGVNEFLVHTGQHYDALMSEVFFEELGIPQPDVNLAVGSGTHGHQTGAMLSGIEDVLVQEKPDAILVYGDTNSTLAGALAAIKLQIPVAHVEAGLRSFNRSMPEEHNRVLTDHCSTILFCPTDTAVEQLAREGIKEGVYLVGDTMCDAVLQFAERARQHSRILLNLELSPGEYYLSTIHRPYNTDDPEALAAILEAFIALDAPIVLPLHPRTRNIAGGNDRLSTLLAHSNIRVIDPVGYLDLLCLLQNARMVLTDSGGLQKEAYLVRTPCITLRPETEWVETVRYGWNVTTGADREKIIAAVRAFRMPDEVPPPVFGDGHAALRIARTLREKLGGETH